MELKKVKFELNMTAWEFCVPEEASSDCNSPISSDTLKSERTQLSSFLQELAYVGFLIHCSLWNMFSVCCNF